MTAAGPSIASVRVAVIERVAGAHDSGGELHELAGRRRGRDRERSVRGQGAFRKDVRAVFLES